MLFRRKMEMVDEADALPGRSQAMPVPAVHAVLGTSLRPPFPDGIRTVTFGMGCFWGAERLFWQTPGVHSTASGYVAGFTPNPTYEEVCSGRTGHTEAVLVAYDPAEVTLAELLKRFWEGHDPTQGMRQGNDVGTQYRSGIYGLRGADLEAAVASRDRFAARLAERGFGDITTEIVDGGEFFYAEDYHQQYLHKVPNGYCGLGGTGVTCPVGIATSE